MSLTKHNCCETALTSTSVSAMSSNFSDAVNEDFLVMDGLDIEEEFLDLSISADSIFNLSLDLPPKEESQKLAITSNETSQLPKRGKPDRSRSPVAKRHRAAVKQRVASPLPPLATTTTASLSPSAVLSSKKRNAQDKRDIAELEEEYKRTMQKLALSMKRSEMTRNEIIRQRQIAETKAKLEKAQEQTYSKANGFLSGSRSTLTLGLEQSRQMLKAYMGQVKTQTF